MSYNWLTVPTPGGWTPPPGGVGTTPLRFFLTVIYYRSGMLYAATASNHQHVGQYFSENIIGLSSSLDVKTQSEQYWMKLCLHRLHQYHKVPENSDKASRCAVCIKAGGTQKQSTMQTKWNRDASAVKHPYVKNILGHQQA